LAKKKKVDPQPPPPITRFPDFSPQFKEDLGWWYKTAPSKVDKIFNLVTDTIKHPFTGIGKPELLKHIDSDTWSRRIDLEHRLVYRVRCDRIDFLQARYHY
jgi:toxin YoeB